LLIFFLDDSQVYLNINTYETIANSQVVEAAYVPINRRMDKENMICLHSGEIMSFTEKQMELEIMSSEIIQTQKDQYHMFSLIYGI
jgi:hypothetical protein